MDLDILQRACASTERFVDNIDADQLALPTPCTEWDVRALLNHVVGTLALHTAVFADALADSGLDLSTPPDLVGDDPAKSYRATAEGFLAACSDGDAFVRSHLTPFGKLPGPMYAGFIVMDILVHGWDLARATGQDPTLEPELAETSLRFTLENINDGNRGPQIQPAVSVAVDASPTDRLVAYLGRQP
ncbi:MAG TPA: TIGR03086 family metal-binding protein [Acidimicrobiales bacterium]